MRLKAETIIEFNKEAYSVINPKNNNTKKPSKYEEALKKVKDEVGELFDLEDAKQLCFMGFFVANKGFSSYESMHAFNGNLYYEDGANLTVTRFLDNPPEFLKDDWYIKATPDYIDFAKLKRLHEQSGAMMMQGDTYESAFKSTKEDNVNEYDWLDAVIECAKKGNKMWFSKDNKLIQELDSYISSKPRRAIVMWALSLADETLKKLSSDMIYDEAPRDAIRKTKDWTFNRGSMKDAKAAIIECHAVAANCKDSIDELYCRAIAQACSVVHSVKHAMGLPLYELTALAKTYGIDECKDVIESRKDYYINRMKTCEVDVNKYEDWAPFLK